MKAWLSASELIGLPGLPTTVQGINERARRESWPWQKRPGRGGGREYPVYALPQETQNELARRVVAAAKPLAPAVDRSPANAQNLAGLHGIKLTRAQVRLAILTAFDTFRHAARLSFSAAEHIFAVDYSAGRIAVEPTVFATLPRIAAKSLQRWRLLAAKQGAARLAGAYRGRREAGKIEGNAALKQILIGIITHNPRLGAAQIWSQLAARVGESQLPTVRRLQAWIARWREENASLLLHVTNPDDAKNRLRPAFGSASEHIVRANQLWEIDDTRADIAVDGGRRILIALIDVATRRMMTLLSETATSAAVLALVRRAILAWGVPEAIKSDNGKNYISAHIEAALQALHIRHDRCQFFSPEQKPHVERSIGTIEHDLFEQLPGYVGHSVAERQAIRARAAFAQRLGTPDTELFRVSMTGVDLQAACDTWCDDIYAYREHGGLAGASPMQIAAEQARHIRRIADERELDLMLAEPAGGGWRTVGKKGIELDGTYFVHGELGPLVGRRLQVKWDVADAGRVVVYDAAGAFVCVAEAPERTGISRKEVASVARAIARKVVTAGREEIRRIGRQVRPERMAIEVLAKAKAEHTADAAAFTGPTIDAVANEAAADAVRALAAPRRTTKAPIVKDPTPEEREDAARRIDEVEAEGAARRSADVVTLPTRAADGKLQKPANVMDDIGYAAWLLDDPANGDDDDRAWLKQKLASWEFRQSLEMNGVLQADGRAAG